MDLQEKFKKETGIEPYENNEMQLKVYFEQHGLLTFVMWRFNYELR